mmetsp:Transcript_62110/g.183572  ORF Transcript_62110/g.183572 Transcript_62110/m.183572 type:complete len:470 (-) Transcript_62110:349-1758(-)
MGFEGMFNGIASWFGVEEDELDTVLPNRANSPRLLSKDDIFHQVTDSPTTSPTATPTDVPSPGTPDMSAGFEFVSTPVRFTRVRSGNTGYSIHANRYAKITITSAHDGPDHLMHMSITGLDLDGGGDLNDSLSWKVRVQGMRGLSTYMCPGFCSAASGGTSGHYVKVNRLGWGVRSGTVDAKESLVFTVEDIVLKTDHRGSYSASFDGFDSMWMTGGQYIFGYGGANLEGRVVPGHSVQDFDPPSPRLQVTTHTSRERNREIGGKFTISGYRDLCVEDGTSCSSSSDCCNGVCHESGYCGDDNFMSQIEWSGTFNLAENQAATQSTTAYGGDASRAVDGNTNGAWRAGSTTHTDSRKKTPAAWWRVDLTRPGMVGSAVIDQIKVWNRNDSCCFFRMDYLKVRILDSFGNVMAMQQIEKAQMLDPHTLTFDPPVEGVTVEVLKDDPRVKDNIIALAEVVVNGRHQMFIGG